jgi:hypothetical protein
MEAETDGQASCCNYGPDNKIDDIMVPQIERRNNKASDEGNKRIKQNPFIAVCKTQDYQNNLCVSAGHDTLCLYVSHIENNTIRLNLLLAYSLCYLNEGFHTIFYSTKEVDVHGGSCKWGFPYSKH